VELELFDYTLDDVNWSERTTLNGKTLSISVADLQEQIRDLSHGIHVDYEFARPGESKRIVHVLDTVLPIAKSKNSGSTFPGFEGAAQLVGAGQTIRIRNLLVTIAARFPHPELMTPIEKPREAMIDMAGVGASYSYGSDYFQLILTLTPDSSVSNAAFDQALRNIALRCARFVAQVEKRNAEPERRIVALDPVDDRLPRVVVI
jgi:glycine reductase